MSQYLRRYVTCVNLVCYNHAFSHPLQTLQTLVAGFTPGDLPNWACALKICTW